MSEIKKVVTIDIDTGQGTKDINDLTNEVKELNNELDNTQGSVGDFNKSIQEVGAEALDTVEKFENVTRVTAGLVGGFESVAAGMNLMGVESETLDKISEKMTSLMALVQGLQAVAEGAEGFKKLSQNAKLFGKSAEKAGKAGARGMKALKKGIAATGIGLLIIAVGTLIANWEEFTAALGIGEKQILKIKSTFNGVMNVISNGFKHLAGALGKLLKGDFSGAGEEFTKIWKTAGDAYNAGVDETYNEAKETAETTAREVAQTEAQSRADDVQHLIKMNEIKEGENFKYTQKGKEMMKRYFDEKKKMYNKDSKDYKSVLEEEAQYYKDYDNWRISETKRTTEEERKAKEEGIKFDDEIIKRMEIQNGKEWRYTEEGISMIKDTLKNKISLTKEGTAERIAAENQLLAFEKEVADHNIQNDKQALKDDVELTNAKLKNAKTLFEADKANAGLKYELTEEGYKATREALEKELALYEEGSKEYEEILTRMAVLDINYQDAQADQKTKEFQEEIDKRIQAVHLLADNLANIINMPVDGFGENFIKVSNVALAGVNKIADSLVNLKDAGKGTADQFQAIGKVVAASGEAAAGVLFAVAEAQDTTTKEGFKTKKAYEISGAILGGLVGILNAWLSAMSPSNAWLTGPGQIALGATMSALIATMTGIQVAAIAKVEPGQGEGGTALSGGAAAVDPGALSALSQSNTVQGAEVQGATLEKSAADTRVYVTESDIKATGKKVSVAESESTF